MACAPRVPPWQMQHSAPAQLTLPLRGLAEILPFPRRPDALVPEAAIHRLHRRLGVLLGEPLDVIGTDNRRDLLSWGRDFDGLLCIRIQRQFAWASDEVVQSIALLIRENDHGARSDVRGFAAGFDLRPRRPRSRRLDGPAGNHHDLQAILEGLKDTWFGGRFSGRIGWAPRRGPVGRHKLRLGAWSPDDRSIRLHRTLDRPEVPAYVVGFVVFHEMLHAVIEPELRSGRRIYHSPAFRERERQHPDFDAADHWLNDNLALLCSE